MNTRIISALVLTMCLLISFVSCKGDSVDGMRVGFTTLQIGARYTF